MIFASMLKATRVAWSLGCESNVVAGIRQRASALQQVSVGADSGPDVLSHPANFGGCSFIPARGGTSAKTTGAMRFRRVPTGQRASDRNGWGRRSDVRGTLWERWGCERNARKWLGCERGTHGSGLGCERNARKRWGEVQEDQYRQDGARVLSTTGQSVSKPELIGCAATAVCPAHDYRATIGLSSPPPRASARTWRRRQR